MTWLWIALLLLLVSPVAALAQTATDPTTTPMQWYGSAAGISAATITVLSVAKRLVGPGTALGKVPTWAYAAMIGSALTAVAAYGFGTMPGGWQLLMQAAQNAATASGFYAWVQSGSTTLSQSAAAAQSSTAKA